MDAIVLNLEVLNGRKVTEVPPFLTQSPFSMESIEIHYLGSEKNVEELLRVAELSSTKRRRDDLNQRVEDEFYQTYGFREPHDNDFVGVKITEPPAVSKGIYDNKLIFKVVPKPGYYLLSLKFEGTYDSPEMKMLDGAIKNSKEIVKKTDKSLSVRYASFLLRLDRVRERDGYTELVFVNFGIIARNDIMTYHSPYVIETAEETPVGFLGKRITPKKMIAKAERKDIVLASVIDTQTKTIYLNTVNAHSVLLPSYLQSYRLVVPKNKWIGVMIQPHELVKVGKKEKVKPLKPFSLSTNVEENILPFYHPTGLPVNIIGKTFVGYVKRFFASTLSYPSYGVEVGNYGFEFNGEKGQSILREVSINEVSKRIKSAEQSELTLEDVRIFAYTEANLIEDLRNMVRTAVSDISSKEAYEVTRRDAE